MSLLKTLRKSGNSQRTLIPGTIRILCSLALPSRVLLRNQVKVTRLWRAKLLVDNFLEFPEFSCHCAAPFQSSLVKGNEKVRVSHA